MQSLQKTEFHQLSPSHFGRLFPELPPLIIKDLQLAKLSEKMKEYKKCLDSKCVPNGLGVFGQFLAHDLTFEVTSKFRGFTNVSQLESHRTYSLDLDCLYGQWTQDFLYDREDRDKMLLGMLCQDDYGNCWYDLQRNAQEKAIIPDARNDENIIVSRIQVLFIEFHNKMVDHMRRLCRRSDVYPDAHRQVIWHYHWLILYEYLWKLMDWDVFNDIMTNGPRFFDKPWFLPLEFTGAAFRFGHSQVREDNRINERIEKDMFGLGSFEKMEAYVDWRYLFDLGDKRVQYAKLIDTKIGKAFHDIPFIRTENKHESSLPFRNMKRGVIYALPSGEDIARRMCFEPIEVPEARQLGFDETPLWFYILKEAEILGHGGEHLGPVGSTIVGETFMAILRNDNNSFLKIHPKWKPDLGRETDKFDFQDLICWVYPELFSAASTEQATSS